MDDRLPRFATEKELATIARFNRTEAAFPDDLTILNLFAQQVRARPAQTAIHCDHDTRHGGDRLTYAQLDARSTQLSQRLREAGVGPGDAVALVVERSFAMIIGILAVLKAGAAYLPVAPDLPRDRVQWMLKDAAVRVLLTHSLTAAPPGFEGVAIDLDDPGLYRESATARLDRARPRDAAYVIYTSGSTGRPKGVVIEHRSLVNRLHWMQCAYPIAAGDMVLQKTPYGFDVSVWELLWWAMNGASACFLRPGAEGNPLAIIETVARHRVTVLHFVPSMLSAFLQYLEARPAAVRGLASVRRVFASGEALTPSHVRRFNALWGSATGTHLTNLYGPTEATVDVSYFDCPSHGDRDLIPIGRPIHNTRFHVLREDLPVGIGEPGELCIAGVGLARGYLNNPLLTEQRFTEHPSIRGERIYHTGDIVRWLPDGNLAYLGREDQQVKIRGLRIELGEIENSITDFPGVSDAVVIVRTPSEHVARIIAYVVCRPDVDFGDLRQHLRNRLPDYMVPHLFERVERIPLTLSGKADRQALPEPAAAEGAA